MQAVVSKTKTEARSTQISKTKHPKLKTCLHFKNTRKFLVKSPMLIQKESSTMTFIECSSKLIRLWIVPVVADLYKSTIRKGFILSIGQPSWFSCNYARHAGTDQKVACVASVSSQDIARKSPFLFFYFCSCSNFRAITRLETLATQATWQGTVSCF